MKARTSRRASGISPEAPFVAPYPPSWINTLSAWVDRLPGPAWVFYVGIALAMAVLLSAVQMAAGRSVSGFNLLVAITVPYLLGLMHYLIRTSAGALEEFRPALRASPAEAEALSYRLTVLPARPVAVTGLLVTMAALALVVATTTLEPVAILVGGVSGSLPATADVFQIAPTPLSLGLASAIMVSSWWVTAAYAYLTVHQLRQINAIYLRHTEIHLLRLGPLYAFSRHTLRSSLGLLVLAYALFATAREVLEGPLGLASWLLLVGGAVATFLVPLLGIHRLLAREKGRMLHETGERMEAGVAELHRRMDRNALSHMDDLNKALASLEIERAALERVPTWPWERGTLRSLVAALVLPLILWLAQALLGRVLGG